MVRFLSSVDEMAVKPGEFSGFQHRVSTCIHYARQASAVLSAAAEGGVGQGQRAWQAWAPRTDGVRHALAQISQHNRNRWKTQIT
jgi:hypothetical protein